MGREKRFKLSVSSNLDANIFLITKMTVSVENSMQYIFHQGMQLWKKSTRLGSKRCIVMSQICYFPGCVLLGKSLNFSSIHLPCL